MLWGAFEEQIVGGSRRKPVEYRIRAKSGSYRWILVRAKATARDARGAPLRVVGINTDVTERHEMEAGLRNCPGGRAESRLHRDHGPTGPVFGTSTRSSRR